MERWFTNPRNSDVEELRQLTELLSKQQWIRGSGPCVLNPTFGVAAGIVDGADADLILGDTLIEVKVTTKLAVTRDMYNQMIGYLALAQIGGVQGKQRNIESMAVYFARHGLLLRWKVSDYLSVQKLSAFCHRLVSMAPARVRQRLDGYRVYGERA